MRTKVRVGGSSSSPLHRAVIAVELAPLKRSEVKALAREAGVDAAKLEAADETSSAWIYNTIREQSSMITSDT